MSKEPRTLRRGDVIQIQPAHPAVHYRFYGLYATVWEIGDGWIECYVSLPVDDHTVSNIWKIWLRPSMYKLVGSAAWVASEESYANEQTREFGLDLGSADNSPDNPSPDGFKQCTCDTLGAIRASCPVHAYSSEPAP